MNLGKVIRFVKIYGLPRTMIKAVGRLRIARLRLFFPRLLLSSANKGSISLIGCGQFGFSTISYFLYKAGKGRFLQCFDTDIEASSFASRFWGYEQAIEAKNLVENEDCQLVYVASNHASHTDYTINALSNGKDVYVEKPISVNRLQLSKLTDAVKASSNQLFVGYNRPFSAAVKEISKGISSTNLPISLNCFVTGHVIDKDHWYRKPEEGTRVCGNLGHWIDLSIHLMALRGNIPDTFHLQCTYSSEQRDDDLVVTYSTSFHDIVSICLTARAEPFEGINESINLQSGSLIAKIDDFRRLKLWEGDNYRSIRFWPKDVGHKRAVLQPFSDETRNFDEILISTLLMLEIKDMVEKGDSIRDYSPFMDEIYLKYKDEANNTRP